MSSSSKTLRSLATLVLLLTAAAHARAAVLYTFSSQAHARPTSDFSFVVDDLLTTTTIIEASDLFDVITYIPDATLGFVVFTDAQTNPNISLVYPNIEDGFIYSRWPEPFTRLGWYTPGTGVTLVISSVTVPEPSTLALLSLALAALGFMRRRRRPRPDDDVLVQGPQGVERDHLRVARDGAHRGGPNALDAHR